MSAESKSRQRLRDIMLRRYLRLGESHTMHEVMGFLTDKHFEENGLPFLVVIAEDGTFAGILEPKAILSSVAGGPMDSESPSDDGFAEIVARNLHLTVGQIMNRDIPRLSPDAFLEDAFLCLAENQTEVAAITEEDRVIGLVTARLLFEIASNLTVGSLTGGVIPPSSS
ncbi:MAG: CBS domain-containing protein [Puniceicoccaceae bacterium]